MTGATEHLQPEEPGTLGKDEFARTSGLPEAQIRELISYGLLSAHKLDLRTALALREAVRLKSDFDLDLFSTGLLTGYIEKVHALQAEVRQLRAEQPVRSVVTEVSYTVVELRRA